ncbi:MAG: hypothetical protein IT318_22725 [Anaerolineales bacterium]|nr:hypothetical protein [Anaerolineales bacterium]
MLLLRRLRIWALALLVGVLAACGQTTVTPGSTASQSTAATLTATLRPVVVVTLTATTGPQPTLAPDEPPATLTALATEAPPEPTRTPTPTEGACANDAEFVADLTVPDGAQFVPGQPIGKQWSVRNNGTCDWDAGYRLVLVSGNALGARSEVALFPARAGATATLEMVMAAPAEPGVYTGRWQARDPGGNLFGDRIFITIEVVAPGPPPETPTPEGGGG